MSTKITTLKGKTSGDDIYPNVLTQNIPDGGVTTAKIADSGITAGKIADGAIITTKIGDGNVTTPKIPDYAITTSKLATGAVTNTKIGTSAVTRNKLYIETGTLADMIRDYSITNVAGLANFIRGLIAMGYLSFYFEDYPAIAPAFACVDGGGAQVDFGYWDSGDPQVVNSITSEAEFLTFANGDATKYNIVRIA